MSTLFLSHTSIDKPFVEKLAKDLKRLGVSVWYDKYEIKVGESIFWKIEEGIRDSEYFAIVLSKEALKSNWVKNEFAAAWQKNINDKRSAILPILYRDCDIPILIQDRKYADFREDYNCGLKDLASVFGIKETDVIIEDNWRKFIKQKASGWKNFLEFEFENLITEICKISRKFNVSVWVSGTQNPYAVTMSARVGHKKFSLSIKMAPSNNYFYMATDCDAYNPNNISRSEFKILIGKTLNETIEYIYNKVDNFVLENGLPKDKPYFHTHKCLKEEEKEKLIKEFVNKLNWDKLY